MDRRSFIQGALIVGASATGIGALVRSLGNSTDPLSELIEEILKKEGKKLVKVGNEPYGRPTYTVTKEDQNEVLEIQYTPRPSSIKVNAIGNLQITTSINPFGDIITIIATKKTLPPDFISATRIDLDNVGYIKNVEEFNVFSERWYRVGDTTRYPRYLPFVEKRLKTLTSYLRSM